MLRIPKRNYNGDYRWDLTGLGVVAARLPEMGSAVNADGKVAQVDPLQGLGFTLRLMDPHSESPNLSPQSPNLPLESPIQQ